MIPSFIANSFWQNTLIWFRCNLASLWFCHLWCKQRSHTHINTFISSLPAYLPIDHSTFDCEMQVSIFGILPSDFVFRNSCKVFWKIWFVIPKTWLQEGKIVEEMHYSYCTEGNLWDVASTCSCARPLYISVLVKLCFCEFVYSCFYVFLYLCICAI